MEVKTNPSGQAFDLSKAVVQARPPVSRLVQKAVQVLIEEVEKRTRFAGPSSRKLRMAMRR